MNEKTLPGATLTHQRILPVHEVHVDHVDTETCTYWRRSYCDRGHGVGETRSAVHSELARPGRSQLQVLRDDDDGGSGSLCNSHKF